MNRDFGPKSTLASINSERHKGDRESLKIFEVHPKIGTDEGNNALP